MDRDETFETETMADLCARQGRVGEAVAIFRHLIEAAPLSPARGRWEERLRALAPQWRGGEDDVTPVPITTPDEPGVSVAAAEDSVTVAWALPASTPSPTLELFVIQRTPSGIETTTRRVPVASPSGRLAFAAPGLHSALAAVGTRRGERFLPLARTRPG